MRISDWSSDVCSSDLAAEFGFAGNLFFAEQLNSFGDAPRFCDAFDDLSSCLVANFWIAMEQAEPSRLMLQIAGEPGDAQEILDMSGLVDANAADDGIRNSTRDKLSLDAASHRDRKSTRLNSSH